MADYRGMTQVRTEPGILNQYMRSVYNWMAVGLGCTALVAYFVATTPAFYQAVFSSPMLLFGLILGELGLVIALSAAMQRLSAGAATGMFLLYSALNGVTLSTVLVIYTGASVFATFMVCAGMFVAMSLYGLTTKKSLTSWGSFLFMGLIGLVIASVVNMFLHSSGLEFVISGIGVVVFVGLTAYDSQRLLQFGASAPVDDALAMRRGSILGALTLYLDFINLFLMLLRFMGQVRE